VPLTADVAFDSESVRVGAPGPLVSILAVAVAAFSVWFAMSAVRELGKQWSLQARLVEGHKLITSGVYQTVRHPIYTAMLGMLIATGITHSQWWATLAGIVIFIIGTKIRTNSEEKLLSNAFGMEFIEWKAKVPGLIPFIGFVSRSGISEKL